MSLRRQEMVAGLAEARGIHDAGVLEALRSLPRHVFAPDPYRHLAYADRALPLGGGRVMPTAAFSATLLEALELRGAEKALELGAGRGYQAGLLASLARDVYAVEASVELAGQAAWALRRSGLERVHLRCADPSLGWPEQAPFDRILISDAPGADPRALAAQVALGGYILVAPGPGGGGMTLWRKASPSVLQREDLPLRADPAALP